MQASEWSEVKKEDAISDLENSSVCVCVKRENGQEAFGGQESGEGVCMEVSHGLALGTVPRAEPCSESGVSATIPSPAMRLPTH